MKNEKLKMKNETSMTKNFDTQENDYFIISFAPSRLCVKIFLLSPPLRLCAFA